MKLVSADFSKADIDALNQWLKVLQIQDKNMTMKRYIKFCVTQMTNTLVAMREKEIQDAADKARGAVPEGVVGDVQVGKGDSASK